MLGHAQSPGLHVRLQRRGTAELLRYGPAPSTISSSASRAGHSRTTGGSRPAVSPALRPQVSSTGWTATFDSTLEPSMIRRINLRVFVPGDCHFQV